MSRRGRHAEAGPGEERLAPIVLFVYRRPSHTRRTLEALARNEEAARSELIVYSDGPSVTGNAEKDARCAADVAEVRSVVANARGFLRVRRHERPRNLGLSASVISGVSEVLAEHGRAIVVEDDIVTEPGFLTFMNDALRTYETDPLVFSVAGYRAPGRLPPDYSHDVFLCTRPSWWGWATWRDRWERADWELRDYDRFARSLRKQLHFNRGGNDLSRLLILARAGWLDSWAIRWAYCHEQNSAYGLLPVRSFVRNIGFDGTGIHCHPTDDYETEMKKDRRRLVLPRSLRLREDVVSAVSGVFGGTSTCTPWLSRARMEDLRLYLRTALQTFPRIHKVLVSARDRLFRWEARR